MPIVLRDLDSPRESLGSKLINYSPILFFALFVLIIECIAVVVTPRFLESPDVGKRLAYIVMFALPLAVPLSFDVFMALKFMWQSLKARSISIPWPKIFSRTLCALYLAQILQVPCWFMMFGFQQWSASSSPDEDHDDPTPPFLIVFFQIAYWGTATFGFWLFGYIWYRYYESQRYRKHIERVEIETFGTPVYLSIPVFKLCGHFVLVVDDWKYELRLRNQTQIPLCESRQLAAEELNTLKMASFGYWRVPIGWTRFSHEERLTRFESALQEFGTYDRLHNNCRHFLLQCSQRALHVVRRLGFADLESSTTITEFITFNLVLLFSVQFSDYSDCLFACLLGPDWDNKPPGPRRDSRWFGARDTNHASVSEDGVPSPDQIASGEEENINLLDERLYQFYGSGSASSPRRRPMTVLEDSPQSPGNTAVAPRNTPAGQSYFAT